MVAAAVIRLGPPLSVSSKAESVKVLSRIGSLKVTSIAATGVFRGLGEAGVIEVIAMTIVVVASAAVGVAWTLPTLSVAML